MPRGMWTSEYEIWDIPPWGATAMIYLLSNNVIGRPASKKSYRTSTIMDDGHETEKPEDEKVNYVRCFFSQCAPGWGQPMTCKETTIDKNSIGMHIDYTTTVSHRMRCRERYPTVCGSLSLPGMLVMTRSIAHSEMIMRLKVIIAEPE